MISGSRPVRIEHAVYGSFSGDRDYRILGASEKVGRKEKASIVPYSNLGISALKGKDWGPVYAFYELEAAPGLWAFSRTKFFGEGGRGNEYLTHVLVLPPQVLQAVRGDVFLLEKLFIDKKPDTEKLDELWLNLEEVEEISRCFREVEGPAFQPALLHALASRSTFVQVRDSNHGARLCSDLLSILPPEDRMSFSFCSRFSQPRSLKFRLRCIIPEDEGEIKPYLKGVQPWTPEAVPGAERAAYARWMEEVGKPGFESLYGISALREPVEATRLTKGIVEWSKWAEGGRSGPSPADSLDGPRLIALAGDERNRRLKSVQALRLEASLRQLRHQVTAFLQGTESSLENLVDACRRVFAEGSSVPQINEFFQFECRRGRSVGDTTAGIALALIVPGSSHIEQVYGPGTWLSGKEEAASWILDLHKMNPDVLLELLQVWFVEWRLREGCALLGKVMEILEEVQSSGALRTAITALEAVAPAEEQERREWFLELFHRTRKHLSHSFTDVQAARLTLDGRILGELADDDLNKLVPYLVTTFAQRLARELETVGITAKILIPLLRFCCAGLRGLYIAEKTWDVCRFPEQWELASRVARQAAFLALEGRSREILPDLTALLWEASKLISPRWQIATSQEDLRWNEALESLVSVCPPGFMDVAAWIVYRFYRAGFDSVMRDGSFGRLCKQALNDGGESNCPTFFCGTLLRLTYLDRESRCFRGG